MLQTCGLLPLNYTSMKMFKYVNRGFPGGGIIHDFNFILLSKYTTGVIHCFNNYGKFMLVF